jgi:hypothetical protein
LGAKSIIGRQSGAGAGDWQALTTGNGLDVVSTTLVWTGLATGNTLYVDAVNGNDGTGTRGRTDKPYLTIAAAFTAASSGDVVMVGPGTFNVSAQIIQPSGVNLIGAGMDVTKIVSTLNSNTAASYVPGTNAITADLTIQDTGALASTVGAIGSDTAFTNAVFQRVKIKGNPDGVIITANGTRSIKFYDCVVSTNYDTVVTTTNGGNTLSVEFWNCDFSADSSLTNPTHIQVCGGGAGVDTTKYFDCNFTLRNSISDNNVIKSFSPTVVELHNCRISKDTSGSGTLYDIDASGGGTISYNDLARDDGKPLEISGTVKNLQAVAPVASQNYIGGFRVDGMLMQPDRLTHASTSRISISGTGRITLYDTQNSLLVVDKTVINPPSFILKDGEFKSHPNRFTAQGNERVTLTGSARIMISGDHSLTTITQPTAVQGQIVAQSPTSLVMANEGGRDYYLSVLIGMGSAIRALPCLGAPDIGATGSGTLTDAQIEVTAVWLPVAFNVTGVKWFQSTQGVYTGDQYNGVGVYGYNSATGTATLLASSANDATIWSTSGSNSWTNKAFSTSPRLPPGVYLIGALYNNSAQTTAPSIAAAGNGSIPGISLDLPNSGKLYSVISGQTVLPATFTMAGASGQTNGRYLVLY